MKLSKKKAIELCRALWRSIARSGVYRKEDAPFWKTHYIDPDTIDLCCFCCEYMINQKDATCIVKGCIINWGTRFCTDDESPFSKWDTATTIKERKKWARVIANLPERKLTRS